MLLPFEAAEAQNTKAFAKICLLPLTQQLPMIKNSRRFISGSATITAQTTSSSSSWKMFWKKTRRFNNKIPSANKSYRSWAEDTARRAEQTTVNMSGYERDG